MSAVDHGADPARLDAAGSELSRLGQSIEQVDLMIGSLSAVLDDAWQGPDVQYLLREVAAVRAQIASSGCALIAFGRLAQEQAAQQVDASGGSGGAGTPSGGGGWGWGSGRSPMEELRERLGTISEPGSGRPGLDLRNELGGEPNKPVIDGGDGTTGTGKTAPEGSVSGESSQKAAPNVEHSEGVTVTMTGESVDSEGRSIQTFQVTQTTEVSAGGEEKQGQVSVDGEVVSGHQVTFEVTGPAGIDPSTINPLDPSTIPEGATVRMSSEVYVGWGLEAQYKELMVSTGASQGQEQSVEITKGPGDTVTVRAGDADVWSARDSVGAGTDQASLSLDSNRSLSSGTGTEVTFDLSTPEGRAAYDQMVLGGEVPAAGTGVSDVVQVETFDASSSADLSAKVGGFSASSTLVDTSSGAVLSTHADGTQTYDWSGSKNGVDISGSTVLDESGTPIPEQTTYTISTSDVDPSTVQNYNDAYAGSGTQVSAPQNVSMTYTSQDLDTMRSQAAQVTAEKINANPGDYPDFPTGDGPVDRQQVLDYVAANPGDAHAVTSPFGNPTTESLLTAGSDEEVLRVMMAHEGGPTGMQTQLGVDYHSATGERIPPVGDVTSRPSA